MEGSLRMFMQCEVTRLLCGSSGRAYDLWGDSEKVKSFRHFTTLFMMLSDVKVTEEHFGESQDKFSNRSI